MPISPKSPFTPKAKKRALILGGFAAMTAALVTAGLGGCQRTEDTTSTQAAQPATLATAAQTATSVRFATIGDFGFDGPALGDVSNLIHSWNPDHILALGDPKVLRAALEAPDGYIRQRELDTRKMIEITESPNVFLPEYSGKMQTRYAKPISAEPEPKGGAGG